MTKRVFDTDKINVLAGHGNLKWMTKRYANIFTTYVSWVYCKMQLINGVFRFDL